jgi:hypothetical protein
MTHGEERPRAARPFLFPRPLQATMMGLWKGMRTRGTVG